MEKIDIPCCFESGAGFWFPNAVLFNLDFTFVQRCLIIMLKQLDYSRTYEEVMKFLSVVLNITEQQLLEELEYLTEIKTVEKDDTCLFPYKSTLQLRIGRNV